MSLKNVKWQLGKKPYIKAAQTEVCSCLGFTQWKNFKLRGARFNRSISQLKRAFWLDEKNEGDYTVLFMNTNNLVLQEIKLC